MKSTKKESSCWYMGADKMEYTKLAYPRLTAFGKEMFRKHPMTEYSNELRIDDEVAALFAYVNLMKDMVNEMADGVELAAKFGEELFKEFKELEKWVKEIGINQIDIMIDTWLEKNMANVIADVAKTVWFGLTDDGYFMAVIPESWNEIEFDTSDNGELILQY